MNSVNNNSILVQMPGMKEASSPDTLKPEQQNLIKDILGYQPVSNKLSGLDKPVTIIISKETGRLRVDFESEKKIFEQPLFIPEKSEHGYIQGLHNLNVATSYTSGIISSIRQGMLAITTPSAGSNLYNLMTALKVYSGFGQALGGGISLANNAAKVMSAKDSEGYDLAVLKTVSSFGLFGFGMTNLITGIGALATGISTFGAAATAYMPFLPIMSGAIAIQGGLRIAIIDSFREEFNQEATSPNKGIEFLYNKLFSEDPNSQEIMRVKFRRRTGIKADEAFCNQVKEARTTLAEAKVKALVGQVRNANIQKLIRQSIATLSYLLIGIGFVALGPLGALVCMVSVTILRLILNYALIDEVVDFIDLNSAASDRDGENLNREISENLELSVTDAAKFKDYLLKSDLSFEVNNVNINSVYNIYASLKNNYKDIWPILSLSGDIPAEEDKIVYIKKNHPQLANRFNKWDADWEEKLGKRQGNQEALLESVFDVFPDKKSDIEALFERQEVLKELLLSKTDNGIPLEAQTPKFSKFLLKLNPDPNSAIQSLWRHVSNFENHNLSEEEQNKLAALDWFYHQQLQEASS